MFDYCVARTGSSEATARELSYEVTTAMAPAPDKAHFMPGAKPLLLKLVVERKSRRLLGAQSTGPGAGDKRIDEAALILTAAGFERVRVMDGGIAMWPFRRLSPAS